MPNDPTAPSTATNQDAQALYRLAKTLIPGGTQLLSKRPELYAPEQWPSYYREARGCEVVDVEGRRFIDMTGMGIGSCPLGYADPDVTAAVVRRVQNGSMCTLNNPEEVELAQLLVQLHPWADNVRFARTGGEAMAVAVRIARAKTGRDLVAICGYHGWHDWYLAANLVAAGRRAAARQPPAAGPGAARRAVATGRHDAAVHLQSARRTLGDCRPPRRSPGRGHHGADPVRPSRAGLPRRRPRLVRPRRRGLGDRRDHGRLAFRPGRGPSALRRRARRRRVRQGPGQRPSDRRDHRPRAR